MKKILYILSVIVALIQSSCQNDPLEEIVAGNWNNERNVLEIKFENQVGKALVTRVDDEKGTITVAINADVMPNLSRVVVQDLVLSYQAKSTVSEGEALNFENAQKSSTITVTSPTGKSRVYTVIASSFTESLVGTYDIDNLILYGGTGPEYGGGALLALIDKPWVWSSTDGPDKELDNQLVFTMAGINEDGNTYGTVLNTSGADNKYADFIYIGNPQTDVNMFYRQIPTGQGNWLRNYKTGTITFTFADGTTKIGTFESAGIEDLGYGKTKTISNNAFKFVLPGTDDWVNIYSDYDKFVKKPRLFWIDVTKK